MREQLRRVRDRDADLDTAAPEIVPAPGRSTLTSRFVFRKERDGNGVSPGYDQAIERAGGGGGAPLPAELRGRFESSLGADLSDVRVHTGAESAAAADAVGARAYTVGNDIHFGAGYYDTGSDAGQTLIAHEVAHTVQQRGGAARAQYKLEVSAPGDAQEVEADAAASAMVAGAPVSIAGGGADRVFRDEAPAAAPAAAGDGKDKDAKPPWLGKKIKFPAKIGGKELGDAEFSMSPPYSAALKLGEAKWEGLKQEKNFPIPVMAGAGFIVGAKVSGGLSAAFGVGITGEEIEYPGPWTGSNKGLRATATASGSVAADIKGEISAGGYLGAPIANIALQGFIGLKGKLEAAATGGGGIQVDPAGTVTGVVTFEASTTAKVEGVGGAKVTYAAVITEGEFGRWELASVTIGEASIKAKVSIDLATGQSTDETVTKFEFVPDLPKPAQVEKRPLTQEEKEKYQKDAKRERDARDGGSGSGPGGPVDPDADDGGGT